MALKIGGCIGEVLDSGKIMMPDKSITMKVKVMLNLSDAVKKGVNAGSKSDGVFWVDFRYEKLTQFCFRCGKIGHGEQGYSHEESESTTNNWGHWLRTNMMGRKIPRIAQARMA